MMLSVILFQAKQLHIFIVEAAVRAQGVAEFHQKRRAPGHGGRYLHHTGDDPAKVHHRLPSGGPENPPGGYGVSVVGRSGRADMDVHTLGPGLHSHRLPGLLWGGIIVGIVGLFGMGINYPIYKKMLANSKQKYAFEIMQLAITHLKSDPSVRSAIGVLYFHWGMKYLVRFQ